MTDRPIIFSALMVRALLAGRKTMTRRLAWNEGTPATIRGRKMTGFRRSSKWQDVKLGDRLWVRENLAVMGNWGVWHEATDMPRQGQFLDDLDPRGRALMERYAASDSLTSARIPSIHMPRWTSRLTLIVTATKIERLQDITDNDVIAEGVLAGQVEDSGKTIDVWFGVPHVGDLSPRDGFTKLWDSLHNPHGYCADDAPHGWQANPEVVALSFTVYKQNIDALAKAA